MTTTGDEPLDPQELIEAAEAAHLAARRTVPIPRTDARRRTGQDSPDPGDLQPTTALSRTGAAGSGSAGRGIAPGTGEYEITGEPAWTELASTEAVASESPASTDQRDERLADRETVRLDGDTVRLDQEQLRRARSAGEIPEAEALGIAGPGAEGPGTQGTPQDGAPGTGALGTGSPPTAPGVGKTAESRRGAPLPVAAAVAALWAALATFLPVAVVVGLLLAAELGGLTPVAAVQVTAAGWLLAHGVPVETGAGTLGLAPLALSAVAAWRLTRAGVHVTRARGGRNSGSMAQVIAVAAAVGIGYGLIGMIVAAVTGGSGWGTPVLRSAGTLAVVGFVLSGYGAMRTTGVLALLRRRIPRVVREAVRTGTVAAAGVLAAGAATAGTALAVSGGPAAEVLAAYGTGVAGQAGLTLLCLAYAPTMAIWAAAYLLGPGFAVGVDTMVRNSEVLVGPLPAVPVFAALPSGPLPGLGAALLVAPVLAGGCGGWLLARRIRRRSNTGLARTEPGNPGNPGKPGKSGETRLGNTGLGDWAELAAGALLTGVVAGLLLGAAAVAATGALGDGQLAVMGPEPVLVAVSTAATVTVGALLGAAIGVGPTRTPSSR